MGAGGPQPAFPAAWLLPCHHESRGWPCSCLREHTSVALHPAACLRTPPWPLIPTDLQDEVDAHLRGRQALEQKLAAQQRRVELAAQQEQHQQGGGA